MARKLNVAFLRDTKEVSENIVPVLVGAATRGAGVLAGAYLAPVVKKVLPSALGNMSGLVLFAVGTLGEAYIANPLAEKACQGIAAGGIFRFAIDSNSQIKNLMEKKGITLSGVDGDEQIGAMPSYEYPFPNTIGAAEPDYTALVNAINQSMNGIEDVPITGVEGVEEVAPISGINIQDNALLGVC